MFKKLLLLSILFLLSISLNLTLTANAKEDEAIDKTKVHAHGTGEPWSPDKIEKLSSGRYDYKITLNHWVNGEEMNHYARQNEYYNINGSDINMRINPLEMRKQEFVLLEAIAVPGAFHAIQPDTEYKMSTVIYANSYDDDPNKLLMKELNMNESSYQEESRPAK